MTLATPAQTSALGEALASLLRAGDVVLLTGDLGAGKTTFTQGLARGLGVRGPITSPTFVIARVHPSLVGGPELVHVDAYRLGGSAELDDLDLDADLEQAVTVVEWGHGLAERLAPSYLEIELARPALDDATDDAPNDLPDDPPDDTDAGPVEVLDVVPVLDVGAAEADADDADDAQVRVATITGHGPRWA